MEKEEAVTKLSQMGIEARFENNLVMVYSDTIEFAKLGETLKSIGYDASYGLRSLKELKHDKPV